MAVGEFIYYYYCCFGRLQKRFNLCCLRIFRLVFLLFMALSSQIRFFNSKKTILILRRVFHTNAFAHIWGRGCTEDKIELFQRLSNYCSSVKCGFCRENFFLNFPRIGYIIRTYILVSHEVNMDLTQCCGKNYNINH